MIRFLLPLLLAQVALTGHSYAHDNWHVHPFGITDSSIGVQAPNIRSTYWELQKFFDDRIENTNGYDPDAAFPNSDACKPGTRGTIDEDAHFLKENNLPYLDHFWTPWDPAGGSRNAIEYARAIFDEAVMHFADGLEKEAFFDFGRCAHVLQDMGSVPHLFSDWHPDVLWANASGFERWCNANRENLPTSGGSEPVASLPSAMEALGRETYRAARISGRLNRDPAHPFGGDLAMLFPDAEYASYIPVDRTNGISEQWLIEGVGSYSPGNDPVGNDDFAWGAAPNLPGENDAHFYIQRNQERIVPANVWDGGAWVPNVGRLSLAQLWAGAAGLRASPAQEHGLIPRTIEYTAGYLKHLWDFVNPPPHLSGVRIEQDQDGDGAIDAGADEVICDRTWVADWNPATLSRDIRTLRKRPEAPAMRLPVRIELRFSEPVRNVTVALGRDAPSLVIGRDLVSERGPPNDEFPDGEPRLVLPGVDIAGLPAGSITLFVTAQDLSNHALPAARALDPDPSTRAGRLPDGSWRNIENGGDYPDTDRNHSFELGGIDIRGVPAFGQCTPGQTFLHAIELRNLGLPAGTEAALGAAGSAPGWSSDAGALAGRKIALPAPSPGWFATGATLTVSCGSAAAPRLETLVSAGAQGLAALTSVTDAVAVTPINDHPDDTQSVTSRRYPTPWLVDTAAPVGVLLNGWGAGIGHLLGRHGMATAQVAPDLRILNGGGAGIDALEVLVVGSGGLAGLDRLSSFREKLARFVEGGGVLIAFTPQRGAELAALPGGRVSGFGWSEDQACFGAAVRIADRDAALAGQTAAVLDAGADGYLTRWPDDATILLERTSNGQPAMIAYPHGAGRVYVLTLYPDWGYGAGQSSPAERALVRDLVTTALAWPAAVPGHRPGDRVATDVPVVNRAWEPTAAVSLEPRTPERAPLPATRIDLPLAPGAFAPIPLELTALEEPGVYPIGYRLLDAGGAPRQTTAGAACFAVFGTNPGPAAAVAGFRIWVTTPSDLVPLGGVADATVHVRNDSAGDFDGAIAVTWVHLGSGPLLWTTGVHLPAGGEASFPVAYPVSYNFPFTLLYGLFAGTEPFPAADFPRRALVTTMKGFEPFTPEADVALSAEAALLRPGVPLPVTVRVSTAAPRTLDAEIVLRVLSPSNRELWTETRRLAVPAAGAGTFAATILTTDGEAGRSRLTAEVRTGGGVIGQGTLFLEQPPLALAVVPALPDPWDPLRPCPLRFSVRNGGTFATPAGTLEAALADAGNTTLWSGSATLPALLPGAEAVVDFTASLKPLPFGDYRLRYAAEVPGGRFPGSRPLRNVVDVAVSATPTVAGDGETLAVGVTVANSGDFAVSGTLALEAAGLLPAMTETLALPPGAAARRNLAAPVTEATPLGSHVVTATFGAAGAVSASARVVVPPARFEYAARPAAAAAGEVLTLAAVNTERNTGTFVWTVRLLPVGTDPDDPLAAPLARAEGVARLPSGASTELALPLPATLATGTYALAAEARDTVSALVFPLRGFVFVRGLEASLSVSPGREVYARDEPVIATASLVNAGAPLEGATLELSVVSAGAIDPVAAAGTIVVSPAGDDALGNGSSERPFATPQRGVDAAPAGHRVLLLAGTYAGGVTLRPGTILQGEVVAGEPAAVIVDADVVGASDTVLDHLALRNGNVIYPGAVSNARVTDCLLAGANRAAAPRGQGVVFLQSVSGALIGRNRLAGFQAGRAGAQFFGAAADVLVLENDFSAFPGASNNGVVFWDAAERITVQGNTFAALAGDGNGVQVWGGGSPLRSLRVLGNRVEGMAGNCTGVQLWERSEGIELRGNVFAALAGACNGIHLWETTVGADLSDNTFSGLQGDSSGIQLWESDAPHLDVRIENNRLADLSPLDDLSVGNGIILWATAERVTIARNLLERVSASGRDRLSSGIVARAGATALTIERNVVRSGDVGVGLRPQDPGPYQPAPALESVVVANNLLAGNEVGFLEENLRVGDSVEFRDGIVLGSTRAGVLALSAMAPGGVAGVHHTNFFGNALDAEGRSNPVGSAGNLSADPLLADIGAGDLRLLPGSPCIDAGSRPTLDLGPLDGDLTVALGPRPVAPAAGVAVHWRSSLSADVGAGETLELQTAVEPLAAAGRLLLVGRLSNAAGQLLAEDAAAFTLQADPVLLTLSTAQAFHRPGEAVPVVLEVLNTGAQTAGGLVIRVTAEDAEVFARTVSLAPGERAMFAFETSATSDTTLHAVAGLAAADLPIRVAAPAATLSLLTPEVAGDEPFPIAALVSNIGLVPADLLLDLAGMADGFTLQPGERRTFTRTAAIARDTVFVARLGGDVTDAVSRTVQYGPRLALRLEAPSPRPEGPAGAALVVTNSGSLAAAAAVSLALETGTGDTRGSWLREIWVPPGSELREEIALGALAPGEYLLRASSGALSTAAPLTILPARLPRILALTVGSALDGAGRLPIAVRVRNDGAAPLAAELSLAANFDEGAMPITLTPGEEREANFALAVAGVQAGDYTAIATLAAEGCQPVSATAPVRLSPNLALVEVPVDALLQPGTPTEVVIVLANTGMVRGEARLRLSCGEFHDQEIAVSVDAGATASARFSVTIGADAASGVPIPAAATLLDSWSGQRETRDFFAWADQPYAVVARGALDRPAYRDGDLARFTLKIANARSGAVTVSAMAGYADHRFRREITLGSPPEIVGIATWALREPEVRLSHDATAGSITSSALDIGDSAGAAVSWDAEVPPGCALGLEARTGPVPGPDASWTAWETARSGEPLPDRHDRFLQYRASFSSPAAGISPALREVRILPADPGRAVTHTTGADFDATPLEVGDSFPVDFAAGDQVFFGVYAASGRSILLDLLPVRRAQTHLSAWTERTRYSGGETIQLAVSTDQAGQLLISTPWESLTQSLPGPGTFPIPIVTPWQIVSGSFPLVVELLGERVEVPVELDGYLVRVLEAGLDRPELLAGEEANLTIVLQSNRDLPDATIDGRLSDGLSAREAFSLPCPIAWGPNRCTIPVPTAGLSGGTWTLSVAVTNRFAGGSPLFLAGAEVWFGILPPNASPTADAGADLAAPERAWVALDGSASADPDGNPLVWQWVQTGGPAVALHGAATAQPRFVAPPVGREGGRLSFSLRVSDGRIWSEADTVEVALADVNRPPVAVAGPDLTRRVGEAAELDATGSHDPDGDPLAFSWVLTSRPHGSAAVLTAADRLVAGLVPDVPGEYEVTLIVGDGAAASAPDTVVVSTVNSRPRADAGGDRAVRAGERVVLDGSASDDADGDPLSFAWTAVQLPAGSTAALEDAAAERASLLVDRCGAFVVELVVDDGTLASEPDRVTLNCTNAAPVADAGPDRAARLGERIVLDGSASRDGDGDPLLFAWAFTALPDGSAAALDDPGAAAPSFTADRTGTFALSLVVGDGSAASEPDGVSVAVGTDVAQATIGLLPAALRLRSPPASLRARIELPDGFSAREIDPAAAAIVAVGKRQLAKPVRRITAKGAAITDADRDGRPEVNLHFPVKPLLRYLRAGTRITLTFKGPLATWGRFVGSAPLLVRD